MSAKTRGLGRGLESLIPTEVIQQQLANEDEGERLGSLALENIKPNPHQPRQNFNDSAIASLALSMEKHGLMQPIVVIATDSHIYQLIAGERRLRAARLLGWKKIAAIVRTADEQHQLELALIENIQRDNLNAMEIAGAYVKLVELFNLDVSEVAKRAGRAESTVRNTIRLLNLPQKAKTALVEGAISEGHARQILALKRPTKQLELLGLIQEKGWSVRQAEQFARKFKEKNVQTKQAVSRTLNETPITKTLSKHLQATVRIQNMAKGGRLLIEFKDDEDLKRLQQILGA